MLFKFLLPGLLLSFNLFAADAPKPEEKKVQTPPVQVAGYNFIGLSLGISKLTENTIQTPSRFGFGAEYSYALMDKLAVGAFISRNNGPIVKDSDIDLGVTRIGAQAAYHVTEESFFDLRTGIGFVNASANVGGAVITSDTAHPFFITPGFGIVVPIMPKIQLIPNIHYTYFFATSEIEQFNVFDVMATVRYQF